MASDLVRLALCVVGVVGSLLIYGVLQERIMTLPFGLYSELRPVAPILSYASVSLSNVVATTCQYEALKHVSFAVQTLGKCAKMFPVMLWGIFILRKRYGLKDVGLAVAITGGCFVFFTLGPTASRVAKGSDSTAFGILLMCGYLVADGYTSTFQQAMFKGYQMTTYNQVLYTCLCSIALSSFGLLTSGQLPATFRFLFNHPEALLSIMALSTAASCGSLCISYTIKSFGALTFATIMTTRQFLSILLSSLAFRNPLTPGQWAGTFIVVTALYYQGLTKDAKHGKEGKGKDDSSSSKLGKEEGKDNGKSKEKEVLTSGSGNGHGTRKAPDPDSAAADKAAAS